MDCVYLIQDATGATKIGITNNIKNRMSGLQVGSPTPLTLRYLIECPSIETAKSIESILHDRYHARQVKGEWFRIEPKVIIDDLLFAFSLMPHVSGCQIYENDEVVPVSPSGRLPPTRYGTHYAPGFNEMIANRILEVVACEPDVQMTKDEICNRFPDHSAVFISYMIKELVRQRTLIAKSAGTNPFKELYYVNAGSR